jgi:hypothetical protein|tara:strand:- start:1996 stop:2793 length:798 start_codon:yes stop_codon:yes gene_type:complete
MASSFFPPDYRPASGSNQEGNKSKGANQNYIDQGKIKDTEKVTMVICGSHPDHVIAGKSYWSHPKENERSIHKKFPSHQGLPANYKEDIDLSFDAKKRQVKYGDHTEKDLAYPRSFISFVAYFSKQTLTNYPDLKDSPGFKVVTFDRNDLRESLEDILGLTESYFQHDNGIYNFKMTLKRKGEGTSTNYTLTPELLTKTPPALTKAWKEQGASIWLPALYTQGDPFAGKPVEALEKPGLPPTRRDDYGADVDIAASSPALPDDWG